jgi:hypothetical protein
MQIRPSTHIEDIEGGKVSFPPILDFGTRR